MMSKADSVLSSSDDDGSSSCVTDPSNTTTTGRNSASVVSSEQDGPLSSKETLAVNRSKILVYAALLLASVAVGATTYIVTSRGEEADFEQQFESFGTEIIDIASRNAGNVFADVTILSTAITTYAMTVNATWPFITVPQFEKRLDDGSVHVTERNPTVFAPLITEGDLEAWETYASQNQGWIKEGLETQGNADVDPGLVPEHIHEFHIVRARRDGDNANHEPHDDHGGHHAEQEDEDEEAGAHHEPGEGSHHAVDDHHGQDGDHGAGHNRLRRRMQGGHGHDHGHHHTAPLEEFKFAAAPIWQVQPAPQDASLVNGDILHDDMFREIIAIITREKHQILSEAVDIFAAAAHHGHHHDPEDPDPHSYLIQPVFDSFDQDSRSVVGVLLGEIAWGAFFDRILPEGLNGFVVEVSDACGTYQTYVVNGPQGERLGAGQLHDPKYNYLVIESLFASQASRWDMHDGEFVENDHCHYQMKIFASDELHSRYITSKPRLYTAIVVLVFVVTIGVFVLYDWLVQRRQERLVKTATRTNAIVSSLFPRDVQRRMMQEVEEQERQESKQKRGGFGFAPRSQIKDFLSDDHKDERGDADAAHVKPIADLFPEVTVMFGDIIGFTAWSSTREPSQVFALLESIYTSFDQIAKQRNVFKVETVGDCYVAAAGLPDPRKDHYIVMARFARDCVTKLSSLVKQLEVELGPDTGDLGMRFGLHSGQVTAGVLRGDRCRFQLFGDTMNLAARMESTGDRNKIQCSLATADLLTASGKGHWVTARSNLVPVKGKGDLQTFWVFVKSDSGASATGSTTDSSMVDRDDISPDEIQAIDLSKIQRLADWNTTNLLARLKAIIARRNASGTKPDTLDTIKALELTSLSKKTRVLEETTEIVKLPHFDPKVAKDQKDPTSVRLSDVVIAEAYDYVRAIAAMYHENPFHNFEHASHVTQSTEKLLSRIIAPDLSDKLDTHDNLDIALDDHTYGITSDPWTQFTVVLAALIHDVDHPGVPNSTLVKEKSAMAAAYNNKSVAESNSIDLAWELLMDDRYKNLRQEIYCTESEFHHFRSLLLNTVLATDIMDKELSGLRKDRWNKAFSEGCLLEDAKVTKDRKATIVIEHLIQASDVAHTMQHWHIYTKWNRYLFEEIYLAYLQGRAEKDPSEGWYKGELCFFDYYVIPLAKKLQSCGVFGVSSSEYLTYAKHNREEFQRKGEALVEEMVENVKFRAHALASAQVAREDWELRGAELSEDQVKSTLLGAQEILT